MNTRLASSALASAIFLLGGTSAKADMDYWEVIRDSSVHDYHYDFYKIDSSTGSRTFVTDKTLNYFIKLDTFFRDPETNKLYVAEGHSAGSNDNFTDASNLYSYDIDNSAWETSGTITYSRMGSQVIDSYTALEATNNRITKNINKLGEGVANATALTAALTALPQASTDSKFSCGVGTGTYSSSYALGVGCASKVNERVDVNFGGSYVRGGSKDYGSGSLENVAAKAGFVFKLGKINNPTLISMKEKKEMQAQNKELQAKVNSFESKNQELSKLVAWQNNQIKIQNQRLEKIEQIALANQKEEKTAFSFLNVSNFFSSMRSFLISSN